MFILILLSHLKKKGVYHGSWACSSFLWYMNANMAPILSFLPARGVCGSSHQEAWFISPPLEFEIASANRVRSKRSCSSSDQTTQETFFISTLSVDHATAMETNPPGPASPRQPFSWPWGQSELSWGGPSPAQISGSAQQVNWLVRKNKCIILFNAFK